MILKLKETADYIAKFIKDHVEQSGAKAAIVGVSGGVDSALVIALCKLAGVRTIGVIMPCHSSSSAKSRADELLKKFEIEHMFIPLDDAHEVINKTRFSSIIWNPRSGEYEYPALNLTKEVTSFANQSLRSCLRAPTLDYVGKLYSGIIVGTGNRDEDEVTRYFQKRGDGCVDLSPIAKLHKSEVYELARYLDVPKSILDAVPSADLMGPDAGHEDEKELGMTYAEIETAMRLTQNHHITSGLGDLQVEGIRGHNLRNTAQFGGIAAPRMIKVLLTLADMEEKSRHKENPSLPVCNPRKINGLLL